MQTVSRVGKLLPGVILGMAGGLVIATGQQYSIGNLTAMGPGFLPVTLGVLLLILSAVLLVGEWRNQLETAGSTIALLPLLLASSSILLWALLVDFIGFIPAALVQLSLASLASPHQHWRGVGLSIVLITLLSYGLFAGLLGLPISAFGG